MPDLSALAAALSSLNAAKDIAQAMMGLRDSAAFQTKLIEFQGKIIDANNAAFAAQDERSSLLEEIRKLKEEVARLDAWETEKKRYELKTLGTGAVAYVLRPEARGTETPHWLCPNCFHQGKKSFFQSDGKTELRRLILKCAECKATIAVTRDLSQWPE